MSDITYNYVNKNFIVVGASSGIGRQIAKELAMSDARVLAVARSEERLNELHNEYPDNVTIGCLDVLVAGADEWSNILGSFVNKYGKINGAVYTAGITGMTPLRSFDDILAKKILNTSFWGMINFLKIATKKKYTEKGASYVLFSSTAAYIGNKGQFAYSAAKSAVKTVIRTFAKEFASIPYRFNSVSPGWVESEMTEEFKKDNGGIAQSVVDAHPLGLGHPEDVSGMVLFLLSDSARWITGTDCVVDGGCLLGRD
ncbi:SDR family NAD(P)-dependent oxidoreductase [Anaerovibrio lipolyticus]|uniref:SDR family NAD(P)-dependent oxidoreductase n=1 Tax=Anaerovibrio lipolyticus TaxID=82374 RepID=UPI0004826D93|nr:SDR family oxidoreductase [Anaerovibrio lipolyticus]